MQGAADAAPAGRAARACAGRLAAAATGLSAGAVWYAQAETHPEALAWSVSTLVVVLVGALLLAQRPPPVVVAGDLTVAGAPLAAARFLPTRRGIRAAVDHLVDRSRFDFRRIVEGVHARVRDGVQLPLLTAHPLATARVTMAPVAPSWWLRAQRAQRVVR